MVKEDTHFAKSVRWAQLFDGPIEPRPGPIFPMAEAAAVNDVSTSKPVIEKITDVITNIKI